MVKPLLRLLQGLQCVNEIKTTLSKLLLDKSQRKADTLDARLFEIVINLVGEKGTTQLDNETIWDTVKANIDGYVDANKPASYETEEYYSISKKRLTEILVDKFGAEKAHDSTGKKRIIKFNQDTLNRLAPNYAKSEDIKILKSSDTSDTSDTSTKQASVFTDTSEHADYNNNQENRDIETSIHEGKDPLNPCDSLDRSSELIDTHPYNPSEPSEMIRQYCGYKTDVYWFEHHHCR